MPRIVVTLDGVGAKLRPPYTMDEKVDPVHLEDEHSSLALIERLAWAIQDAKHAEGRVSFHPQPCTEPVD